MYVSLLGGSVFVSENQDLHVFLRLFGISEPLEASIWVNVASVDGFATGMNI